MAPVISNFLFHSPKDAKQEQKEYVELKIEIRDYLNSPSFRRVISQILFDLQKDVSGGTRERLFNLYKELDLHHDAFQKLKSWRWATVSQGILELSQMEVDESYLLIRKFINDKRAVVRKQAELAIVSLRPDGVDYLLDTTRHSISEWQQIKLIETLSKRKNYQPPQFKAWLLSQNNDVVLFALRLIKHYNQKGAELSIRELVKHKNDQVRIAAIQCVIDFNFKSALPELKGVFKNSSSSVKIKILNAIAVLGTELDIPFLRSQAATDKNFIVVSKANASINSILPETILPSNDIDDINQIDELTHEQSDEFNSSQWKTEYDLGNNEKKVPVSIEVEEIECYDEIEVPPTKTKTALSQPEEPAFELKSIEEEYGTSMDRLLGLVPSSETNMDSHDLLGTYEQLPNAEKSKLVGMMEDAADEHELPLLEHITENETDSELRYQAFKTIQSIQRESECQIEDIKQGGPEHIDNERDSIFYDLYHHTDEGETKLILLEELIEVGDKRDIPFLKSLLGEKDKSIARQVQKALEMLENMVDETELISEEFNVQKDFSIDDAINKTDRESYDKEKHEKIPMELFLLYEEMDLKQNENKKEDSYPFDFELSQEFFIEIGNSGINSKALTHE